MLFPKCSAALFTRGILALSLVAALSSCSKFGRLSDSEKLTKVTFDSARQGSRKAGRMMASSTQLGGVMIWGFSDKGASFASPLPDESQQITVSLPNGNWAFAAVGWTGTGSSPVNQLEGVTRCGRANAALTGTDTSVPIGIDPAGCSDSFFGSSSFTFTDTGNGSILQLQPLQLITCNNFSSVSGGSSNCNGNNRGDLRSYQVQLVAFQQTGGDANLGGGTVVNSGAITSECYVLSTSTGNSSVVTSARIPVASAPPAPIRTIVNGFTTADCSGAATPFSFQSGLSNAGGRAGSLLFENSTNKTAALYLLHGTPPPTISNLSPAGGNVSGGYPLTITGANFDATSTVMIGGSPCTNPSVTGTTQITCTVPTLSQGPQTVQVTTGGGLTGSLANGFDAEPAPGAFNISGVQSGQDTLQLTWGNASGATSYDLLCGTSTGVYTITQPGVTSPFTLSSLTPGQQYFCIVKGINIGGSTSTAEVNAIPFGAWGTVNANVGSAGGQLSVTFSPVVGATSYTVNYGVSSGVYGPSVPNAVSPVVLPGLTAGIPYFIEVVANNANGTLASAEVSAVPIASFSMSPATLSGPGGVQLSWGAAAGTTQFEVRYGTSTGNYTTLASSNATSPFTVTGLTSGTTYHFMVTAENSGGTLDASAEQVAIPIASFTVASVAGGPGNATVTWSQPPGATGADVIYGTSSGSLSNTLPNATSPKVVAGLTAGTPEFFSVNAKNTYGSVQASNTLSATPLGPFSFTGVAPSAAGQVTLSWSSSAGASSNGYVVKYGTSSGSYPTTFTTSASLSSTVTGLTPGSTYFFLVTATNSGGAANISSEIAVPIPTLEGSFTSGTLPTAFSYVRTGSATRWNSSGFIETLPFNSPRFDFDPNSLSAMGVLVESPGQNLLGFTNHLEEASWQLGTAAQVVSNGGGPALDGSGGGANLLFEAAAAGTHEITTPTFATPGTNLPYTLSVFAKPSGRTKLTLVLGDGSSATISSDFTLTGSGTASNSTQSGWTFSSSSIQALPSGWYRVALTGVSNSNTSVKGGYFLNNGSGTSYTGDGTSGTLLWGEQLEPGTVASSFIPTPNQLQYSDQLQQTSAWAETGIASFSVGSGGGSITNATALASPDGTFDAEKLAEDSSSGNHQISQTGVVQYNKSFTLSFYAHAAERAHLFAKVMNNGTGNGLEADYDLSGGSVSSSSPLGFGALQPATITSVGNGWFFCTLPGMVDVNPTTPVVTLALENSPGSSAYAGTSGSGLYVWGVQLEMGTSVTTYQQTSTSALRPADQLFVHPLGSWFSSSQSSLAVNVALPAAPPSGVSLPAAVISDQTSSNFFGAFLQNVGPATKMSFTGTPQTGAGPQSYSYPARTPFLVASSFTTNSQEICVGALCSTANAGQVPTSVNTLVIGADALGNFLNGWVRGVQYFPTTSTLGFLGLYTQ